MADAKIEQRIEDGILILELNNPPVNSYTHEMLRQFEDIILQARFDEDVHAILITGKLEKFFSAGADINMLSKQSLNYKYNFALHGHEVLLRLENTPKLIVAAINGHSLGGGLEIAMSADIRIAKKDAGRMGLAEIGLGVMPGMGGTQRLPRLVGKAKALELCATGRQIAFEEALEMGLIHYIYEKDNFMEQVLEYTRQFVPPRKASLAVGKIKRAIHSGIEESLAEGLALEREVLYQTFASEDGNEGVQAFLQKKTPQFKGR
ncbi:MAG: enoyl-CoA hydratase/isomerase family protein [Candidatus Binatia bacterium]|jgi:enoyl-CoA hydratase/carnithine racemase|nr:enoyl-CoA hydratase/isomerase family protein [Candidatus Binatia bacterium]